MAILIAGLAIFLGVHSLTMFQPIRNSFITKLGEHGYKGLYSLISIVGFCLLIYGYGLARESGSPLLYDPPVWLRHLTMLLMMPVFIFLVAAYVPCKIRASLKHPMLVAIKLWAVAHLLSNGDLASVLVFGSLLVWAVVDRISIKRRSQKIADEDKSQVSAKRFSDAFVILIGLSIYAAFVFKLHVGLIGVPVA